ncbi:hypothetical protein SAMN06297229_0241 [Pseudidiomarina planktonica]|uniref:Uncharacterized protein n=1 Tax=Pseudidiomarina planktonica TaxID=1323738 RepID=A0A1Y6E9J3_9GAMM|nr:hypothetical protein SAMN06297229_0241 [Pseudidiomarina planktonica]
MKLAKLENQVATASDGANLVGGPCMVIALVLFVAK